MNRRRQLITAIAVLALALLSAGVARATGTIERISLGPGGAKADDLSYSPDISADGRYVVFASDATNLVANDTNGVADIFLYDRQTRQLRLLSVGLGGPADGESLTPVISADGRVVAFASVATNLVTADNNSTSDIFVVELPGGAISRVSVGPGGAEADGRSDHPAISGDGRYVAFSSMATTLVSGDVNGKQDIFVRDRASSTTSRVSVSSSGGEADSMSSFPAISGGGTVIAFTSAAANLVSGDTNRRPDIFVRDTAAGRTTRVSVRTGGNESDGPSLDADLSADGRLVVFASDATNLVGGDANGQTDVFLHNRTSGATVRISTQTNAAADLPAISGDGTRITYSTAAALAPEDTNTHRDIYAHDIAAATTTLLTLGHDGQAADDGSNDSALSVDGRIVALLSDAGNLLQDDDDRATDVFVHMAPLPPTQPTYLSARATVALGKTKYAPNDILIHQRPGDNWAALFDASVVAAALKQNLNAFTFLPDGSLLLAFQKPQKLTGVGTATPYDVVRFTPSAPGSYNAGAFTLYLAGANVGLSKPTEAIDALAWSPAGQLVISTGGTAVVPCAAASPFCVGGQLTVQDEDLIAYQPSGTGGTWTMVFDGSAIAGLAAEDIGGAAYDAAGRLYLSFYDKFKAGGVSGTAGMIVRVEPDGGNTRLVADWDGAAAGFRGAIDGFELGR